MLIQKKKNHLLNCKPHSLKNFLITDQTIPYLLREGDLFCIAYASKSATQYFKCLGFNSLCIEDPLYNPNFYKHPASSEKKLYFPIGEDILGAQCVGLNFNDFSSFRTTCTFPVYSSISEVIEDQPFCTSAVMICEDISTSKLFNLYLTYSNKITPTTPLTLPDIKKEDRLETAYGFRIHCLRYDTKEIILFKINSV